MKKKLLAAALAGAMVLGSATTAFAATTVTGDTVDCTGWWANFTPGYEVDADGVDVTFTNTTYATAEQNWNGPIVVVYSADNGEVNGEGYVEYWVGRGDGYGWTGEINTNTAEAMEAAGITFTPGTVSDTYLAELKAGAECEVKASMADGKAIVEFTSGTCITTVSVPVDTYTKTYVSIGGELTFLSNIQEVVEADSNDSVNSSVTAGVVTVDDATVEEIQNKVELADAPEGTTLKVAAVEETKLAAVKNLVTAKATLKDKVVVALDLTLLDSTSAAVQPDGSIKITMPVTSLFTAVPSYVAVYREDAAVTGGLRFIETAAVTADGNIAFSTDHFSTYIFAAVDSATFSDTNAAVDNNDDTTTEEPTTSGDKDTNAGTTAGLLSLVVLGGAALVTVTVLAFRKKVNE